MKHVWSEDYIAAQHSPHDTHEWIMNKLAEFERKTGVKWSHEPAHGQHIFNPYMRQIDAANFDQDAAERIIDWLKERKGWGLNYFTLLAISESANLPLPVVCGTCWMLVKIMALKGTVDRMGKPTAVALFKEAGK